MKSKEMKENLIKNVLFDQTWRKTKPINSDWTRSSPDRQWSLYFENHHRKSPSNFGALDTVSLFKLSWSITTVEEVCPVPRVCVWSLQEVCARENDTTKAWSRGEEPANHWPPSGLRIDPCRSVSSGLRAAHQHHHHHLLWGPSVHGARLCFMTGLQCLIFTAEWNERFRHWWEFDEKCNSI